MSLTSSQHFLIGAACNIGALQLEQRARDLHIAAQNLQLTGHHDSQIDVLIAMVEEALKSCISVAVAYVRLGVDNTGAAGLHRKVFSGSSDDRLAKPRRRTSSVVHPHGNDSPIRPIRATKRQLPAALGSLDSCVTEVERVAAAKPADDDSGMVETFQQLRHHLDAVRWHNRRGSPGAARAEAAAAAAGAAAAGLPRVAAAAERIAAAGGCYLQADVVEQLEILIDSAEALWGSSRCRL